jgi:NAD(P)-dependent dehydrogenase (short-subunit alcohol dehydrogenase family)
MENGMKHLRGKLAVVTGAGSGIGRATALRLAREGAHVAVLDLRAQTAEHTAAQIASAGGTAAAFAVDVSDRHQVDETAAEIERSMGRAAILVNNAGVMIKTEPLSEAPYANFQLAVAVNLWGVVHCTCAFLPQLRSHPQASLINVSSMGGLIGFMLQTPYCTTKFAVRGFTEALRMELLDSSVRVSGVYPGHIDTPVIDNSPTLSEADKSVLRAQIAKARPHSPDKVAAAIVRCVRSGQARALVGHETYIIDWIARLLPGSADRLLHPLIRKMTATGTAATASRQPQS